MNFSLVSFQVTESCERRDVANWEKACIGTKMLVHVLPVKCFELV